MRIAKTIGNVTLGRCLDSYESAMLRLAITFAEEDDIRGTRPTGDTLVVWDELAVPTGATIGICEGPEATRPFLPDRKPVDAYAAMLIDEIDLTYIEPAQ